MAVTPTGYWAGPLGNLRDILAESETWQSWCGVETAAAAKAYIHYVIVPYANRTTRPFVLIDVQNGFELTRQAPGITRNTGRLLMMIETPIPDGYSEADAQLDHQNKIGAMLAEILAIGSQNGYLSITSVTNTDGPSRPLEEDRDSDDFLQSIFQIDYGP